MRWPGLSEFNIIIMQSIPRVARDCIGGGLSEHRIYEQCSLY